MLLQNWPVTNFFRKNSGLKLQLPEIKTEYTLEIFWYVSGEQHTTDLKMMQLA